MRNFLKFGNLCVIMDELGNVCNFFSRFEGIKNYL